MDHMAWSSQFLHPIGYLSWASHCLPTKTERCAPGSLGAGSSWWNIPVGRMRLQRGAGGSWQRMWVSMCLPNSGGSDRKESACNVEDWGSIAGSGRFPGKGNGNPLQYSCLGNPTARGAWQATVYRVAKSQTRLCSWHFHNPGGRPGRKNHHPNFLLLSAPDNGSLH